MHVTRPAGNVNINEVTLRRAGLVLRWATDRGDTVFLFNQAATQANSAWSSLRGQVKWVLAIVTATAIGRNRRRKMESIHGEGFCIERVSWVLD